MIEHSGIAEIMAVLSLLVVDYVLERRRRRHRPTQVIKIVLDSRERRRRKRSK